MHTCVSFLLLFAVATIHNGQIRSGGRNYGSGDSRSETRVRITKDSSALGTIHILRKQLYCTKLNLTAYFVPKTVIFFVKTKEFIEVNLYQKHLFLEHGGEYVVWHPQFQIPNSSPVVILWVS